MTIAPLSQRGFFVVRPNDGPIHRPTEHIISMIGKCKNMDHASTRRASGSIYVFDDRFLDGKKFYQNHFNKLPSFYFIGAIDGDKAYDSFIQEYASMVADELKYRWFNSQKKKYEFDRTVLLLNNEVILEFNQGYCEIFHDGSQEAFVEKVTLICRKFKNRNKKEPREINLVVRSGNVLDFRTMEIKPSKLDLDLFYEADFKEIDEVIRRRLNKKKDKGIVLLHGLPGTGKTTYLRYLIGKIRKRVMFLSPHVAGNLLGPDFIDLLIDNPETVLVIEDAENIIMDRRSNSSSSVSNLLNISDGLLADFLNVQIICTFNSELTFVDKALLRKGRLIAQYEFGKLSVEKAQRLSNHLGFEKIIDKPMTLAEISNPDGPGAQLEHTRVLGFRREVLEN